MTDQQGPSYSMSEITNIKGSLLGPPLVIWLSAMIFDMTFMYGLHATHLRLGYSDGIYLMSRLALLEIRIVCAK